MSWGIGYYNYCTMESVYYRMPLNFIVAVARQLRFLWYRVMQEPKWATAIERDAYAAGLKDGRLSAERKLAEHKHLCLLLVNIFDQVHCKGGDPDSDLEACAPLFQISGKLGKEIRMAAFRLLGG